MDTIEHLNRLKAQLNDVFDETVSGSGVCKQVSYYSGCLFEFSDKIGDNDTKEIIASVAAQFESAALFSAFGLYRQAMASLRLALELGFASVYFSANKLELQEWRHGGWDLKWGQMSDPECGVLSIRYARAFFASLTEEVNGYNGKAKAAYKTLSEYVHGNFQTWNSDGNAIRFDHELAKEVQKIMKTSFEVILFALAVRFLDRMSEQQLDKIGFVRDEFEHIEALRLKFGGPRG